MYNFAEDFAPFISDNVIRGLIAKLVEKNGIPNAKYIESDNAPKVKEKLEMMKEKYGKPYCPCISPSKHCDDVVCPCKLYKLTGYCRCNLYKE
jgi:ferredoxin-thioredoxin reductase catalytic subunit